MGWVHHLMGLAYLLNCFDSDAVVDAEYVPVPVPVPLLAPVPPPVPPAADPAIVVPAGRGGGRGRGKGRGRGYTLTGEQVANSEGIVQWMTVRDLSLALYAKVAHSAGLRQGGVALG